MDFDGIVFSPLPLSPTLQRGYSACVKEGLSADIYALKRGGGVVGERGLFFQDLVLPGP